MLNKLVVDIFMLTICTLSSNTGGAKNFTHLRNLINKQEINTVQLATLGGGLGAGVDPCGNRANSQCRPRAVEALICHCIICYGLY